MKLLVAGGAGFIGSTYVRRHLAENPDDEIVVLDKLTYAGRPENLAAADPERFRLVEADIADRDAVAEAIAGCDAVVNFAAESHVDRSIEDPGAFIQTDVFGTYVLLGGRPRRRHPPPADLHRRGLRLDRAGHLHRGEPARSLLAVLGFEGRRRSDRQAPSTTPTAPTR